MTTTLAIIGGSGFYQMEGSTPLEEIRVETPFGMPSDNILRAQVEGCEVYFLARHGKNHSISPSEINYRANIYALKKLGVNFVLSVSAVGSLKEEHAPRKIVLPDQFIDWTKGLRERTFFSQGIVGHVSCANPVEKSLQELVAHCCRELSIDHSVGGSYVCIEGPQFSTRAESAIYRSFGADIIGMTNVPEAFLAKEAALGYATVAMVTDYDCWKDEHCTLEEIMAVMKDNNKTATRLIKKVVSSLSSANLKVTKENDFAVVTQASEFSSFHREILGVLVGNNK